MATVTRPWWRRNERIVTVVRSTDSPFGQRNPDVARCAVRSVQCRACGVHVGVTGAPMLSCPRCGAAEIVVETGAPVRTQT
uniref:Uncharacterized protein n=1 Tax=viral metagenome TaxID=1070528 RepID=A0A6M3LYC7_9ZZZZ